MSPIGNILLMHCNRDMTIDLEKAIRLLPEVKVHRIRAVAMMIGVIILGDS